MDKNKKGGKRIGAGRKPSGIQKKTISIYIEKGDIYKFGNDDKLRAKLYEFISTYGETPNIQDLNKPTNEIKPFQQPQTNFPINTHTFGTQPIINRKSFLQYQKEKRELETDEQYNTWLAQVQSDVFLSTKEKNLLKTQL